jgi:tetratricopeptide (TPR) repeat protein/two-component sensor histidine kinase
MIYKKILVICLFFLFIFISSTTLAGPNNISNNQGLKDTSRLKMLLGKGEKLRDSRPDSSKYFYHLAIAAAGNLSNDKAENHLVSLAYIGLASVNCNMGDYPESLRNIALALKLADKFQDNDIKAQALNIRGLLHYNQSRYDSAVVNYQEALRLAKIAVNKRVQAKIYTNLAIIKYLQGNFEPALRNFENTLAIARDLGDIELMNGTWINMGLIASNFGEYPKAIHYYNKAIEGYEKVDGKAGLLLCYQNLGSLYLQTGDFGKTAEAFNSSLKLSEDVGDKVNISIAHHNLAELYAKVGDYDQAMQEYLKSIRLKEEQGDKKNLTEGYNGIGNLLYQHSEYQKALEYYKKSLQINQELNLVRGISIDYSYMANVFAAQNLFSQAITYYQKALDLSKSIHNKTGVSDLYISLGMTYSKLKQFGRAREYLLMALKQKSELGEKENIATVHCELANYEFSLAENSPPEDKFLHYQKAEDYGLKAFHSAELIQSIQVMNIASYALKKIYKSMGNYEQALKFAEKYSSTNDSLFNKAKAEAINYAEGRWSVEKQQNIIQGLERQKKFQSELLEGKVKESKQQKLIIYISAGLLLLTVVFIIFLYLYNRKRREIFHQEQLNRLAVLKLQNIRNRMSPHFLFNTLSSISHSVNEPELLKNKISQMSLLLRRIIENTEKTAIPLEEELQIVKAFVDLQREKIASPFTFDIQVTREIDPAMLIPAMILQIPVENALKHGLMSKEQGPCELMIKAVKHDSNIQIKITDNGPGPSVNGSKYPGTGTGLKMVMQNIHFLNSKNKNKIQFSIKEIQNTEQDSSGTIVEIIIPDKYSFELKTKL